MGYFIKILNIILQSFWVLWQIHRPSAENSSLLTGYSTAYIKKKPLPQRRS
jgi:hypothetical protein